MITNRQSIADALSTVDGVTGYVEMPTLVGVGDAWPDVVGLDRGPGQAFQTTWRVTVVLSQDSLEARDQMTDMVPAIAEGVAAVLFVDAANPTRIPVNDGVLYGAELIARSE